VFKKNVQGKYRPLPQERIDKLTELGFVWHAGFSRGCPSSATKATAGGSTPVLPSVAAAGSDGGGCVGVPVAGTIEAKNDNITKDSAESDDPGKASSGLQHVPAASNDTNEFANEENMPCMDSAPPPLPWLEADHVPVPLTDALGKDDSEGEQSDAPPHANMKKRKAKSEDETDFEAKHEDESTCSKKKSHTSRKSRNEVWDKRFAELFAY